MGRVPRRTQGHKLRVGDRVRWSRAFRESMKMQVDPVGHVTALLGPSRSAGNALGVRVRWQGVPDVAAGSFVFEKRLEKVES